MSDDDENQVAEGWAFAKLRDGLVQDVQPGFAFGAHNRAGEGVPHLRPMNVSVEGRIDLADVKYVPASAVDRDERWITAGDVLFNNTNSPELVGKTAVYTESTPRAFSNHMTRVRCRTEAVDPRFCALALHHYWQIGHYQAVCNNHVSQASIGRSVLLDTELPLPPLAEQRRIVAKVEALLARVQAARQRLARVPLLLKRFRQAVLTAACNGQLTADWREGHYSQKPRLSTRGKNGTSIPEDELPEVAIPSEWAWASTESLCDESRAITYGVIKLGARVEGGVPTLRSSDVRPLYIDRTSIKSISPTIANQYARTYLKGGEVLVTVRGTLGGVAVVSPDMAGYNISREVAQLPVTGASDAEYLMYAIASGASQGWLEERAKGVAYTGINIADLRRLPLPLPPLAEQHEIVRRVDALFQLAAAIERRVAAATARAERLTQAILAKAFRGELVPTEADLARAEGREYETASQLLERVRASQPPPPGRKQPRTKPPRAAKPARRGQ